MNHARRWWLRTTRGGRWTRRLEIRPALRNDPGLAALVERRLANRMSEASRDRAEAVLEGRFRFHHHELRLPDPVDWRVDGHGDVDHLWRFQLHYHEFLLDLLAADGETGDKRMVKRAWDLVAQWIAANPLSEVRSHDDAWHPFCISRRVPVWIVLWHAAPSGGDSLPDVAESLYRQARFLASHPERDLGGNHLIENARALALVGCYFSGPEPDNWLRLCREILFRELPEQILPHGEHFERSPMYHMQMLDALLDVRDVVRNVDPELSRHCADAAVRMARFLEGILHPDGELPLLGDSAFDEAPPAGRLIRQATSGEGTVNRVSVHGPSDTRGERLGDYWRWRNGDDFLLLDAGPVGPDHLPAHAHSDLSTFELSIAGKRLIVDSGVFGYRDDELRRYCRSTAAHNVLAIDDREQCDTWSRFRMGYRGRPIGAETGNVNEFDWVRVRHDAYRRLGIPVVGRWIACRPGGPWLIVDWAMGRGGHEFSNRLHLHPDIEIESKAPGEIRIRLGAAVLRLGSLLGNGKIDIVEGRYCPQFGCCRAAPLVQWTNRVELPAACGWWLARGESSGGASLECPDSRFGSLRWNGQDEQIEFPAEIVFGDTQGNGGLRPN